MNIKETHCEHCQYKFYGCPEINNKVDITHCPSFKDFNPIDIVRRHIVIDVDHERRMQDNKWGVQNHSPERWMAILMEETGEVAKAVLENSLLEYRKELIQVAAVAVAMIECMERNLTKEE